MYAGACPAIALTASALGDHARTSLVSPRLWFMLGSSTNYHIFTPEKSLFSVCPLLWASSEAPMAHSRSKSWPGGPTSSWINRMWRLHCKETCTRIAPKKWKLTFQSRSTLYFCHFKDIHIHATTLLEWLLKLYFIFACGQLKTIGYVQ